MTQRPKGISVILGMYFGRVQASGKKESQPPKNRIVARQETVIIAVYSAMKNMANLKLAYSVWKPATSSDSASGRSKGARLVSAIAEVKKQMKPNICGKGAATTLQAGSNPQSTRPCCVSIMRCKLKVFAISNTPTTDMVSASS